MKHSISDLLDDVYVDDIELKTLAPLSPRRIKNRTMGHIEAPTGRAHRWLGRIAVAAAVIVLMTLTAFAADTALNDGAMWDKLFGKALSENQMTLIDDMGKTFGESITVNGTTITPLRAVADAKVCFLYMRVEAPEGVILPDLDNSGEYDYSYELGGNYSTQCQLWYKRAEKGEVHKVDACASMEPLPDDDPTDNVKEFVVQFTTDGDFAFMDRNSSTKLYFSGIYIHKWMTPEWDRVLGGEFIIDISINNVNRDDQMVKIDTGGVSFYNEEYDYTTTVDAVKIYSLHVELDYSYTTPSDPLIWPYGGPLQLVMKDGTVVEAQGDYLDARDQRYVYPEDIVGCSNWSYFEEPIVVEDIDYIILGTEHIFDVN